MKITPLEISNEDRLVELSIHPKNRTSAWNDGTYIRSRSTFEIVHSHGPMTSTPIPTKSEYQEIYFPTLYGNQENYCYQHYQQNPIYYNIPLRNHEAVVYSNTPVVTKSYSSTVLYFDGKDKRRDREKCHIRILLGTFLCLVLLAFTLPFWLPENTGHLKYHGHGDNTKQIVNISEEIPLRSNNIHERRATFPKDSSWITRNAHIHPKVASSTNNGKIKENVGTILDLPIRIIYSFDDADPDHEAFVETVA